MKLGVAYALLVGVTVVRPAAQAVPPFDRFEVASVRKTATPGGVIGARNEPGGRFIGTNLSLRDLLGIAYQVRDFQIVGGPSWLASERFDVLAKAEGELPPFNPTATDVGPIERMMQSLLADRFRLVAHRETREMPIYALVMARDDRRLGEKLRASSTDCAKVFADRARGGQAGPLMAGDRPDCGMAIAPWSIRIGGGPLSQLTMVLSQMTRRLVVDRTGLTGKYDVDLQWTPQGVRLPPSPPGDAPPAPVPAPPVDPKGVPLETAIQEQLGLELEPSRAPVPVLVVDRAEPLVQD